VEKGVRFLPNCGLLYASLARKLDKAAIWPDGTPIWLEIQNFSLVQNEKLRVSTLFPTYVARDGRLSYFLIEPYPYR
jgi:hypothetical protein